MIQAISFKARVNYVPNAVQQAQTNSAHGQLNQIEDGVRNGQLSDISAMTQRMQAESMMNDAKVAPVQYVEEIKPQNNATQSAAASVESPKNVTDVIKNFHKGKSYSKVEHSNMLMNQMNQYAVSNRILHGLV